MRKNSFIQGAVILTIAGIIVKFIGAFSRIYLSRLLGGEEGHLPRGRRGRPPKNAPTCGEAPAGETGR